MYDESNTSRLIRSSSGTNPEPASVGAHRKWKSCIERETKKTRRLRPIPGETTTGLTIPFRGTQFANAVNNVLFNLNVEDLRRRGPPRHHIHCPAGE